MTDLRKLNEDRIEGIREVVSFDLDDLGADQVGVAVLIQGGDLAWVLLASRDDDGRALDLELHSFHAEHRIDGVAYTLRDETLREH